MIESLKEYILVAQDEILVEKYLRHSDDSLIYTKVADVDRVLSLSSIQREIGLREIYDKAV